MTLTLDGKSGMGDERSGTEVERLGVRERAITAARQMITWP